MSNINDFVIEDGVLKKYTGMPNISAVLITVISLLRVYVTRAMLLMIHLHKVIKKCKKVEQY